jgi:hypothetical protein
VRHLTTTRLARLVELLLAVATFAVASSGWPFATPWGFALGY